MQCDNGAVERQNRSCISISDGGGAIGLFGLVDEDDAADLVAELDETNEKELGIREGDGEICQTYEQT